MMPISSARLLIATLWCGSLWTIGYLVAPALFATLSDRMLAGTIAGSLFRIEAWLSIGAALALIALDRVAAVSDAASAKKRLRLILGMSACTLAGYFALHPFMAALRAAAGPGGVMAPDARTQFGILHGVSSALYFVQSLLGAALMLTLRDASLGQPAKGVERG
jgi:hypothetical protein